MDRKAPVVTYVICNYNYGKYLVDAIKSASEQDYPKDCLRINFVDDASTDDSVEILEKEIISQSTNIERLSNKYQNCSHTKCVYNGVELNIFLSQTNQKQASARNIAIEFSLDRTDLYAILDADDMNFKIKIKRCVSEWMQAPEMIGAIYADYHTINIDNNVISYDYKKPYDKMILNRECIVHSGSIISKKALLKCREIEGFFFDPSMPPCEDYDLWMRISEYFIILHVPEPLSFVRIHNKNCTHTISGEYWQKQVTKVFTKAQKRNV